MLCCKVIPRVVKNIHGVTVLSGSVLAFSCLFLLLWANTRLTDTTIKPAKKPINVSIKLTATAGLCHGIIFIIRITATYNLARLMLNN